MSGRPDAVVAAVAASEKQPPGLIAEARASLHEIASITRHESLREAKRHTRADSRARLGSHP